MLNEQKKMSLENYINQLEKEYIGGISYFQRENKKEIHGQFPVQLKELYEKYNGVIFPFGMIYSVEQAVETSSRLPFVEEKWFCFGQDDFFSYWLCKMDAAAEDLAFTIWDHEMQPVIEKPSFQTLEEVLNYAANEYNSSKLDECNVVIKKCDENGLRELLQAKKMFSSEISISRIKQKVSEGSCVIKSHINKYEAKRILSSYAFKHITITIETID